MFSTLALLLLVSPLTLAARYGPNLSTEVINFALEKIESLKLGYCKKVIEGVENWEQQVIGFKSKRC